ncbi:MAG: hypothetical protein FWE21_00035 [Defluviitaleaceae bacterium]|nr:hypothetical protein [Defluviitaleaceae bacterium]
MDNTHELLGKWEFQTSEPQAPYFEFLKSGIVLTSTADGASLEGNWSSLNDKLALSFSGKTMNTTYCISDDTLKITMESGEANEYKKVVAGSSIHELIGSQAREQAHEEKAVQEKQEALGNLSGCFSALAGIVGLILLGVGIWVLWDVFF